MPEYARLPAQQTCPACGSEWLTEASIQDRYGFSWRLSTCGRCGLSFQTEPLTTEARREFYGSGEYRRLCAQVTGKPWTDRRYLKEQQASYGAQWLRSPRLSLRDGHWLDYGGSTGVVSQMWSGYNMFARVIVADYGDGATTTPEDAIERGRTQPYDAILCCQTFDHLPNPLEMARTFLEITRPGGTLFVDVVKAGQTALKCDHDTYWPSVGCFAGCLERAGWVIQWVDGETDPTHWAVGAVKP